ncbi:glucosaminidase domain-containing protein [Persephonella sp.]
MKPKISEYLKSLKIRELTVVTLLIFVYAGYLYYKVFIFTNDTQTTKEEENYILIERVKPIYISLTTPYGIPPVENCDMVNPYVYTKVVSLKSLPVKERKKRFISLILPSILIENFKIEQNRKVVLKIKEKIENNQELLPVEEKFLYDLFEEYRVENIGDLLKRLNTSPVSIILAQAAIESGWGTSRFFVEANNVFGVWTFKKDGNYKIKAKNSNAYLKVYNNILEAVDDYYYSINVGWAYENFRLVRLQTDDPLLLTNHLEKYSILRKVYVQRLKSIIVANNLQKYDNCNLNPDFIYTDILK